MSSKWSSRRILWFEFWESIKALKTNFGSMGSSNKRSSTRQAFWIYKVSLDERPWSEQISKNMQQNSRKIIHLTATQKKPWYQLDDSMFRFDFRRWLRCAMKPWLQKTNDSKIPVWAIHCTRTLGTMRVERCVLLIIFTVEIKDQMIHYLILISWLAESLPFKERISYDLSPSDETSLHLKWLIGVQSTFSLCQKMWKNDDATCSKDFSTQPPWTPVSHALLWLVIAAFTVPLVQMDACSIHREEVILK